MAGGGRRVETMHGRINLKKKCQNLNNTPNQLLLLRERRESRINKF